MKNVLKPVLLLIVSLYLISNNYAQNDSNYLTEEDSAALNALVMYPEAVRIDILEACMVPAGILKISDLQKKSSAEFVKLVGNYKKEEQEIFWNLSRYPDLITILAENKDISEDRFSTILENYPEEIRNPARLANKNNFYVLQEINKIQNNTQNEFEQIIYTYPVRTQQAYRELLNYPEVLSLLNEHLNLTIRAGDRYKKDPKGTLQIADSINLVITRQNAKELADWKEEIQKDPEQEKELKNASSDYLAYNGYNKDEINNSIDYEYINNYKCVPYPYWFGYPVWYPYNYWYPYPYWYDCGFYYNSFNQIVIIGLPSYYFTNWYFYYPIHIHHYPHLCNTYIKHYYGPRRPTHRNTVIVHNWVRDKSKYLPNDFISNNSKRVEVIRQIGKLDVDVQKQHPGFVTSQNRDKYFENNKNKYPALNDRKVQDANVNNKVPTIRPERPERQPTVVSPKPGRQPVDQSPKRENKKEEYDFDKLKKAQEHHEDTWKRPESNKRIEPTPSRQPNPSIKRETERPTPKPQIPQKTSQRIQTPAKRK